jgi:ribose/xylose/arabinose/galactoside ABC-type transport system permease subunit
VTTSGFFTLDNGKAILASAAVVGILAIGETVIMISGNLFSLGIAATAAVSAMAFVYELQHGLVLAIVVAILVATLANGIQGLVIGRWRANPIIVTIAAGTLCEGIGAQLTGSQELVPPNGSTSYLELIKSIGGIPLSVYIFLVLAVVVELILRRTSFGVSIYLLGDNREAARAAALPVTRIIIGVFILAGVMAGIAGILLAAINGDASLSLEGSNTYNAIAAALVGGTAVAGGRGSIGRTVFGCLVIAAVSDLVVLRGYTTGIQDLVEGVLVVIAVLIVRITSRAEA